MDGVVAQILSTIQIIMFVYDSLEDTTNFAHMTVVFVVMA
jgi:hypothetical protein